ncbi:DMT family protein [Nostoc sp. CHAB 5844]|nr:DMT family protein [Nostoc sp. CHAB 5844]
MFKPIILLLISNIFMTFAWYGHLKDLKSAPLWIAINTIKINGQHALNRKIT